jgi:hypothetical protein
VVVARRTRRHAAARSERRYAQTFGVIVIISSSLKDMIITYACCLHRLREAFRHPHFFRLPQRTDQRHSPVAVVLTSGVVGAIVIAREWGGGRGRSPSLRRRRKWIRAHARRFTTPTPSRWAQINEGIFAMLHRGGWPIALRGWRSVALRLAALRTTVAKGFPAARRILWLSMTMMVSMMAPAPRRWRQDHVPGTVLGRRELRAIVAVVGVVALSAGETSKVLSGGTFIAECEPQS